MKKNCLPNIFCSTDNYFFNLLVYDYRTHFSNIPSGRRSESNLHSLAGHCDEVANSTSAPWSHPVHLDPGAVNGDHSPIPEQQFHAAGVHVEMAGSFIVLHVCVPSALRHSYSGLSCFLMIRSRTFLDGSKGFILFSEEYKKSEPFSYWKKVRILLLWCTSRDSNPGPTD